MAPARRKRKEAGEQSLLPTVNEKGTRAAVAVAGLCVAGAVLALLMLAEIGWFLFSLKASPLAEPPRTGNLLLALPVLVGLALSLAVVARRTIRPGSLHHAAASRWSVGFILVWGGLFGYAWLVNDPVPPQAHHTGKFLLLAGLGLAWGLWYLLAPHRTEAALNSRPYRLIKVLLVNLLVFVAVGEAALRLADPILARSGLFGDNHTPANLKPQTPVRGSIAVSNSQGFREPERVLARTGTAPRVLALGDSFTWGAGVSYDEVFVTRLEQALQQTAPGAEIVNLGVPAWGPHEERHLLETYGIQFGPDLVMLNFFVGNDIQNKRGSDTNLTEILVVAGQSYYVHRNGNWVHDTLGPDRWYLYHNLNYLIQVGMSRLLRMTRSQEGSMAVESAPLVSRPRYLKAIHERSDIYRKERSRFFDFHWANTRATLLAIRDFLRARKIPLLVVLLPDHVQLDPRLQKEYLASVGGAPEDYDFQKPQRVLRAWCEENGIPVLDLFPAFQAEEDLAQLYFANDIHWTSEGHRLAAGEVLPVLQAQLARRRPDQAAFRP